MVGSMSRRKAVTVSAFHNLLVIAFGSVSTRARTMHERLDDFTSYGVG